MSKSKDYEVGTWVCAIGGSVCIGFRAHSVMVGVGVFLIVAAIACIVTITVAALPN